MDKINVLVTGATGNVGTATIRQLVAKYPETVNVYAAVTNVEKARPALPWAGVEFVPFHFEDLAEVGRALTGMNKLFLLRPPQLSDVNKYMKPVIQLAREKGIKHVVFLSLQGVEKNTVTPHYKIEQLLKEAQIPYTFLRPSFFMQNLTTTHRAEIAERSEIFIPAGRGKTNFVDVRDVGEVAALVLHNNQHLNKAYELTGSAAYDYDQIAEVLSRILNRRIEYKNPSVLHFFWRKWGEGNPISFTVVMIALYTVAKLGKAAGYAADLEELLGRSPTSFEQFAQDYRNAWQ